MEFSLILLYLYKCFFSNKVLSVFIRTFVIPNQYKNIINKKINNYEKQGVIICIDDVFFSDIISADLSGNG